MFISMHTMLLNPIVLIKNDKMHTEQLINQQTILDALEHGVTVLTGNNRLANALIEKYDAYNIANKKTAWSSPDIIPINSWLINNWEEAVLSGKIASDTILLSSEQEAQVWEAIIKQSPYGNGLLRISATAKSVADAWRLLQNWALSRDADDYKDSEDAKAFDYWSSEFEKRCAKEHWIVAAQLASQDFYTNLVKDTDIILLGFDELTPQLQNLVSAIKSSTSFTAEIKWCRQEFNGELVSRLQCRDVRDEIETFAVWARQRLEENSLNRIGLVVPDISGIRAILLHTLERVLIPSNSASILSSDTSETVITQPWDISMGVALSDYSLIKLAFQLLGIVHGKLTIEDVSSLLRSPHIAGANAELNQRALLDRQLRDLGEPFVSLKTLLFYCSKEDKKYNCPELTELVAALIELRKSCYNKADNKQWAEWFHQWLMAAGWGAGRTVSSEEYQTIEAWKSLLHSFTSLQTVSNKMSLDEAISSLHRLASDKIFQIQSKSAPIQILGVYESIGLNFDHLWVMNLHDEVWPVSPRPNPFIPLHSQKKFGLPHASWERELVIAKQITLRLKNSAHNVVFSYPEKNGIQECRPSPLILGYAKTTKQDLSIVTTVSWLTIIQQQSQLDELTDDSVVKVGLEKISGGSSIFKNQSLCPFRAFVENRLHAKPMREAKLGLDAMKRGSLLHGVLERFWKTITDQQQLITAEVDELEAIINTCINEAIEDMVQKSPDTFTDSFTKIEKQRLLQLTLKWLELEKQRAPFKVVGTEHELTININGVNAHLFIDRVDELQDGRQMVIDYKTGMVSPSDWFGERPNDPQLPLYSYAANRELTISSLSAVLFAQIKTGDVKFNGVVEQHDLVPNLPPNRKGDLKSATEHWPAVLTDWESVLHSLANDFVNSHIEVNPKKDTITCDKLYCELSALCRINELKDVNGKSNSSGDME